jgi:glycosidase
MKYIFLFLIGAFISCKKNAKTQVLDEPITLIDSDPEQYEAPFLNVPNTEDIIMYEINQRAFSVQGDFNGIIQRLDSIKALGVNTIWLMPIFPIGSIKSVNSPYSIKNYKEVNSEFGNIDDLRKLVRLAHQKNIAVILDWVANHTAWDNPWIQNPTWYTQDGSGNIIHPAGTNWQDVADLNFNNYDMRKAMIKALKYWVLTANVDGYRCDAADLVPYDFWKQAIDSLKTIKNRKLIMLAEGARSDHFNAGFNLNFSWNFFSTSKGIFKNGASAANYFQSHISEYGSIPFGSHKLRFTSNHDECAWDDTPLGLYGGKQASMAAFTLACYMGGVPLIYNGQEVGCPVKLPFFSKSPIDWSTNPDMLMKYKQLIGLRKQNAVLRTGTLTDYSSNDVVAFTKKDNSSQFLILVNTRNSYVSYSIPINLQNLSWTNAVNNTSINLASSITLAAHDILILQN